MWKSLIKQGLFGYNENIKLDGKNKIYDNFDDLALIKRIFCL